MAYLLPGVAVIVLIGVLMVGLIRGRVRVRSCCGSADPEKDVRMRGAVSSASTGTSARTAQDR